MCGAVLRRDDETGPGSPVPGAEGPPVHGAEDALRRLLRGELRGHLWNKLFRRELVEAARAGGGPFPPTRAFSDLGGVLGLLTRAEVVTLVDEALYTYVVHRGSILNSRASRPRDLLDVLGCAEAAVARFPPSPGMADDLLRFRYSWVLVPLLNDLLRRGSTDADALAVRREALGQVRLRDVVRLVRLGDRRTAAALPLRWAPGPYALAYRLFRRLKWGSVGYW